MGLELAAFVVDVSQPCEPRFRLVAEKGVVENLVVDV